MTIKHLFPPAWPKLDLNFAATRELDPRITFTRSSIGTYVNEHGILQTAAEDEPRFDHDPETGESLGLLIEESRTNILTQSVTMSDWNATAQLSLNQAVAPDSTNTATKLYQTDAVDGTQYQQLQGVNFGTGGAEQVFSIFVKAAENNYFFAKNDQDNFWAILDLTDGTVTSNSQDYIDKAIGVQSFSNGWYRLKVETGNSGYGRQTWGISPSKSVSAAADLRFVGDGTSGVYVWGAQIEDQTRMMTSYIPTSGSELTRSQDICTITGDNFSSWYNPSEGTMIADVGPSLRPGDAVYLQGSGSSNRIMVNGNPDLNFQVAGTNNGTNIRFYNVVDGNPMKFAYAIKPGDYAFAVRGNSLTASTGTISSVTNMTIGRNKAYGETNRLNGCVARLAYYNERLADAELQTLTS